MLCKSFLLIRVVTGYFPVTPSKAVGKDQTAFRHFCCSSAEVHGYSKADFDFPCCMFLIQKQTFPPVFARVKVRVLVKLDSPQLSWVDGLSLTVTLLEDMKELSQTLPETRYTAAAFVEDTKYFLFPEKIWDWILFDMWWNGKPGAFKTLQEKTKGAFIGCTRRLLSGTVLTRIDFSVGDTAKEGARRDLMEIKRCLAESYMVLLLWEWRKCDSDCSQIDHANHGSANSLPFPLMG